MEADSNGPVEKIRAHFVANINKQSEGRFFTSELFNQLSSPKLLEIFFILQQKEEFFWKKWIKKWLFASKMKKFTWSDL